MTMLKKWLNNPYLIALMLVFWGTLDLIILGRHCKLSPSDWGTWVGSVGTVAAFIGTIYLARTETRRRERADLLLAQLHATGMVLRLIHAKEAIAAVARMLFEASTSDRPLAFLHDAKGFYAQINVWTMEELIPLAPLSGNVALNLAKAADQLHALRAILDNEIQNAANFSSISTRLNASVFERNLGETMGLVDAALKVCQAVRPLHQNGPVS